MGYKNVNVDIRITPLKFYKDLLDKPSLNEHELIDNTTLEQIGLGNVDNTSDINKPISNSTKEALDLKADKSELNTILKRKNIEYITDNIWKKMK